MTLSKRICFVASMAILQGVVYAQAGTAAAGTAQAGQTVYVQRCMQCHSINKDQVLLGPSLWSEMSHSPHKKTAAEIREIIKNGKGKMPPWNGILSDSDINNVIAYLHSL